MLWTQLTQSLDDVRRLRPEGIFPGDAEPAWLRRAAEYERELPLLRNQQTTADDDEQKDGLLGRLLLALRIG